MYFLDESGFNTASPVPYAWQKVGEVMALPAARSRNLSVLGCLNHALDGQFEIVEGAVDSQKLIDFIDRFVAERVEPTIPCLLILDNAPIHRSHAFRDKLLGWQAQGVVVAYLPPYSPELNHIEILWRKMKYEWLPLTAWEGIGQKYQITFV